MTLDLNPQLFKRVRESTGTYQTHWAQALCSRMSYMLTGKGLASQSFEREFCQSDRENQLKYIANAANALRTVPSFQHHAECIDDLTKGYVHMTYTIDNTQSRRNLLMRASKISAIAYQMADPVLAGRFDNHAGGLGLISPMLAGRFDNHENTGGLELNAMDGEIIFDPLPISYTTPIVSESIVDVVVLHRSKSPSKFTGNRGIVYGIISEDKVIFDAAKETPDDLPSLNLPQATWREAYRLLHDN